MTYVECGDPCLAFRRGFLLLRQVPSVVLAGYPAYEGFMPDWLPHDFTYFEIGKALIPSLAGALAGALAAQGNCGPQ
jgi:hypothetical protein